MNKEIIIVGYPNKAIFLCSHIEKKNADNISIILQNAEIPHYQPFCNSIGIINTDSHPTYISLKHLKKAAKILNISEYSTQNIRL